jgi:hypothetical protein
MQGKSHYAVTKKYLLLWLMTGAAGCAPIFSHIPEPQFRPLETTAGVESPTESTFYQSAVTAINRRDYATALDYLQAARVKQPNNVRVLNAFGVVYDKLGRFDLSARYYAQANALDPKSQIVAKNMSYSRWLQGLFDPQSASSQIALAENQAIPLAKESVTESTPPTAIQKAVQADILPASAPQPVLEMPVSLPAASAPVPGPEKASNTLAPLPVATSPTNSPYVIKAGIEPELISVIPVNNIEMTIQPLTVAGVSEDQRVVEALPRATTALARPVRPHFLLTGHPLAIVNASGSPSAVQVVRRNLAARGWSLSRSVTMTVLSQPYTTLTYPQVSHGAALGLAKTLPVQTRLVVNACNCGGLSLTLGSNFKGWNAGGRKLAQKSSTGPSVAALSDSGLKGVR